MQSREAAVSAENRLDVDLCSHEAAMSAENRLDFDLCKVMKLQCSRESFGR